MKLVLDADAAALLPELAGSPRKQGECVSRLIREEAVRQHAGARPSDAASALRRRAYELATELNALTGQLMALAGDAGDGAPV